MLRTSVNFTSLGLSPIVEISERAAAIAPEFEKETGQPFIYFQRGEIGFDTPAYITNAFCEAVTIKKLTKYPKSGGYQWFKDAVIAHLKEIGISDIHRDNVVATHGGQEGLELAILQIAPQARVASFGPIWSCMLENILPYAQASLEMIPLNLENLEIDYIKLDQVLSRSDVLYINTPHNPTGKVFKHNELETINTLCKKHNVFIISDEAYKDIVFGVKHTSMLEFEGDHIISIFTGSKSFAATGLRMGYAVSRNRSFIEGMTRGNYTQTAGLAGPQQYALASALNLVDQRTEWLNSFIGELYERRSILYAGLSKYFDKVHCPEGGFYFWINCNSFLNGKGDKHLVDTLLNNGVAVVHGSAFGAGYEGYVRLSFSTIDKTTLRHAPSQLMNAMRKL